jgi:hypothetical protein
MRPKIVVFALFFFLMAGVISPISAQTATTGKDNGSFTEELLTGGVIIIIAITLMMLWSRKGQSATGQPETKSPTTLDACLEPAEKKQSPRTPEQLLGHNPTPAEVKQCLDENNLNEAEFTVHLPDSDMIFLYTALRNDSGKIMAQFSGQPRDRAVRLEDRRRIAKKLHDAGSLIPFRLSEPKVAPINRAS